VRLFSQAAVDKFFTVPKEFADHGRALGWDMFSGYASSFGDMFTADSTPNHTGYTGTSMAIDMERGVAVILLTNRVHPIDDGAVARTRAVVSNIVMTALDK
jgi:CubicO group peptidase (beta-lactamase class C family)